MPQLILTTADGERAVFSLQAGRKRRIGSSSRCSIRLDSRSAEPIHCEVFYASGLWQVRDLNSITGTRLNGKPVSTEVLADGDSIELGAARVTFAAGTRASNRPRSSRRRAASFRRSAPLAPLVGVSTFLIIALVAVLALLSRRSGDSPDAAASTWTDGTETPPVATTPPPATPAPASEGRTPNTPEPTPEPPLGRALADATSAESELESSSSPSTDVSAEPPAPTPELAAEPPDAAPQPESERPEGRGERELEAARQAERWREALLLELAVLDFDLAKRRLEEGRVDGLDAETLAALEEEWREARDAWRSLQAALARARSQKTTFELAQDSVLISAEPVGTLRVKLEKGLQVRVLDVVGARVELGDRRGAKLGAFRTLSLPDELLLEVASAAGAASTASDSTSEAETRRRIARLLLYSEGPKRASGLRALPEGEADESEAWLLRKAWVLSRACARLEERGNASAGEWALLASELLSVLATAAPRPDNANAIRRLRENFVLARRTSLPVATLFRAGTIERVDGGRLRLVYDFTDRKNALAQAADLELVGNASHPPRLFKGRLVLQGEYRLAAGTPFLDRLSVRGKAAPLAPDAPNVNVALWTQPVDAVTCLDGESTTWLSLLQRAPENPADFFVFGMGYHTVVCSALGRPSAEVVLVETRQTVKLPALVVLAGKRGSPLHKDLGECLFAQPVSLEKSKRLDFRIDWGDEVTWTVNGTRVPLAAAPARSRFGARSGRRGSISLVTNGRPVAFERLEVVGRLDPEWVDVQGRERAERDLGLFVKTR